MATKEHRRFARGLIEALESRVHAGPPVHATEIASAHEFLRQSSFSPTSDYYSRLTGIQDRLTGRSLQPAPARGKRNYGGEAAGRWMQVVSVYDHVILSTCYDGEFNLKRGRVKISHRFNSEGRIDFVELKFLRSLLPCLTGEIRKLILIRNYPDLQKDWQEAEAFTLRVLPQELLFLFADIFHYPKGEILGWLINIGHRMGGDLLADLSAGASRRAGLESTVIQDQLCLPELRKDEVAWPILEKAAALESVVEVSDDKTAVVRYHRL